MDATVFISGLVLLAVYGGGGVLLFAMWRGNQRKRYDQMRRTYVATFPKDLPHEAVLNFFRTLSGLPSPKPWRAVHTVVFETYATAEGIKHYLTVPGNVKMDVENIFRTHIVGGSLIRDAPLLEPWEEARELRTSAGDKAIRIGDPAAVAATMLSSFSLLKAGQAMLMQWVISPAHHRAPTPETKEKLAEPNFLSVCRIAARGEDADNLVRHMYTSLRSTETHEVRFIYRTVFAVQLKDRIKRRAGMLIYPSIFNAKELSVLLGFPFGSPNVAGLPGGRARHLPADHMIPTDGVIVGQSSFPGMDARRLAIPYSALMTHEWVLGGTGSGKSTLLHNQAVNIMNAGHGLIVIEPKGDLARDILKSVPIERSADVIWFDATDGSMPIGLNVLSGSDPERTTAHLVSLFRHLYGDSWGPRLEQILRYSILTAAAAGLTLYDVKQLLVNTDYRSRIVRASKDREVKQFWRRFDDMSDVAGDSVVNKLDGFLGSRAIRNIVGQTHGLNMAGVVRKHKILLVPLPSSMLGESNASMLGSLIVDQLWNEIRLREPNARYPIVLMLDEFQNYLNLSVAMEDTFAEARSYQLGLIVANQHTAQLSGTVLSAVKANARSKIVFGVAHDDAEKLHKEFVPLNTSDLQTLSQYEVAAQIMTETGTAPVATAKTAPPPRPTNDGQALIAASRATYGRDYKDVENELARRHQEVAPRKLPKIEGLD